MKLLNIIANKGLYSKSGIAKELNISEGMLEGLLQELVRMDYIEKVKSSGCSGGCSCCSSKSTCASASGNNANVEFWSITEKGRKKVSK